MKKEIAEEFILHHLTVTVSAHGNVSGYGVLHNFQ